MKYIKTYESAENNLSLKPGEYVKIIPPGDYDKRIRYFLNNNVGVVYNVELNIYNTNGYFYNVKFNNIPDELCTFTRYMGSNPEKRPGLKEKGEIFVAYDDNIRLATPDEIDKQLMKDNTHKYNI